MSRYGLHLACLVVLAAQVGLWRLAHRESAGLQRIAEQGSDPRERVEARFLLLERGHVEQARLELVWLPALLGSPDPLEADFVHTTSLCKYTGAERQSAHIREQVTLGRIDGSLWRQFVILRRKIGAPVGGSSTRLRRRELAWWFDSLAGRPLPTEELLEQVRTYP